MIPSIWLIKTNAVKYQLLKYPQEIRDTTIVAQHVGVEPHELYKGLIVLDSSGCPLIIMIPSNLKLDLKLLSLALGKNLKMASPAQAEKATGLKVGGISPLALTDKEIPLFIEQSIKHLDRVVMSAGKRGIAVKLSVSDLVKLTKAKFIKLY